ncbi:hypothetical protein RGUI_0211 [Rhodovulum sp. P5]|uniref:regulatory protein GemA n=1 Tax=Rhodovulum sp. P5 TaxID=1564506 RepID=UPI0009C31AAF|nr:regulatory protein GemA [Rhodovulum sp. P5]ARE38352.1 hypothetical protein RGUI_0211 [Rhodovulum sp. P5]
MALSSKQTALIKVATTKLGMPDAVYRSALVEIAGVTTSKDLDAEGFDALIGWFQYLGFEPGTPRGKDYGSRPGMATFAQIELIRELWREIHGASDCDDAALLGWLRKFHKVDSMRFLTMEGARKAITGLKAWKRRAA